MEHGAPTMKSADRYQVVIHIDADTLHTGNTGRCEIEDGPTIAAETVRRIACDASIVGMIENDAGEPFDIGRKSRSIPPSIRRALKARDKGCRFPGCTHARWVDAHHIHHWADGGTTKLPNLVLLCRSHHRLIHEGGVAIHTLDDGALQFVRPNGIPFEEFPSPQTSSWNTLPDNHARQGLEITPNTAATLWRGERMDYELGIFVLLQQAERAKRAQVATDVPHQ